MDWILNLFHPHCAFCYKPVTQWKQSICENCLQNCSHLEVSLPLFLNAMNISVIAGTHYKGWIQNIILKQKKQSHPIAIQWITRWLWEKMPSNWKTIPFVWVPSKPFQSFHLVENLALEFCKLGWSTLEKINYRRTFKNLLAQKKLNLKERKINHQKSIYKKNLCTSKHVPYIFSISCLGNAPQATLWNSLRAEQQKAPAQVILFDDIVTTGNTLLGFSEFLKSEFNIQTVGAVSIAHTPKYIQ